jgi:hypothetical protein
MTDDEIERALGAYAPAAPRASLRARVVASADPPRDRWLWIAAAAMLAMALGLHALASRTIDTSVAPVASAAILDPEMDWVALSVGGDTQTHDAVRAFLLAERARDDREAHDRTAVEATWIH